MSKYSKEKKQHALELMSAPEKLSVPEAAMRTGVSKATLYLRKGSFKIEQKDRIFNPSRESARLLAKAQRIGPRTAEFARELFARLGRPGHRALYGLANLARTHTCADIEVVCARLLDAQMFSYATLKRALERRVAAIAAAAAFGTLAQGDSDIQCLTEYQALWDCHAQTHPQEQTDDDVDH